MSTPGDLLTVRGLAKSYGSRRALDDVGFVVRRGEVLGLIGPNGAGKTTLFECLAGLLPSDGGEVRATRALAPSERREALFFVPDGIAPWADQPVWRLLDSFCRLWRVGHERRAEVVASLRLAPHLTSLVRSLSKGERKRVLLAVGLLATAPLLMLDEPFDGLDLRQAREVLGVLRAEAARGRTLFLSIHQLHDAARACDRFVLLADGRVVGEGTLDELRARAGVGDGGMEEVFLALT